MSALEGGVGVDGLGPADSRSMTMLPNRSPATVTGWPEAVAARISLLQHLLTDSDGLAGIDGSQEAMGPRWWPDGSPLLAWCPGNRFVPIAVFSSA